MKKAQQASFSIDTKLLSNSPEQARTGGTHQPELTIFLAFYSIMGEENMERKADVIKKKKE